jgi:hypothetical protein
MHLPQAWRRRLLCAVMFLAAHPAAAFNITIDYTFDAANGGNNFFGSSNPQGLTGGNQAKAALEAAASYYNTILTDTFDPITIPGPYDSSVSGAGTVSWSWQASFPNPSNNSASQVTVTNPVIGTDQFRVYAGGRSLSGSEAGQGGFGGFTTASTSVSGTNSFTTADQTIINATTATLNHAITTRGELSGFSRWGGAITFDNDGSTSWFFNHLGTPSGNVTDFYSVAIHELGHSLGLGTSTDWQALVAGSNFIGANATVQNKGSAVPLSTPDLAHWANGTNSFVYGTATPQEAAMDPSLQNGTRKKLTALDAAGLQDIGWSPVAPAVIGDYNSNGSVDAADYVLWRRNLNRNVFMPNRGASGQITLADYNVWRTNFGRIAPGSGSTALDAGGAVPEPASGLLALIFVTFAYCNRSTRRR